MNKSSVLLFVLLFAFGCGKIIQKEEILRAEINGESWQANRIITQTNDVGELISIEGHAADNSRLLFTLLDTELNTSPSDLPEDADGNTIAGNIHLSIVPDLVQIRYHLEILGAQPYLDRIIIEQSPDGTNFTGFHQIVFDGRTNFTESWVATNDRASNNSYVIYRYKIIYNTSETWISEVQLGTTSFQGSYDDGLTKGQTSGEFTLTQYDKNKKLLSGEFTFDTADDQIRNGELTDIEW